MNATCNVCLFQVDSHGKFLQENFHEFDNYQDLSNAKESSWIYPPKDGVTTVTLFEKGHFNKNKKTRGKLALQNYVPKNPLESFLKSLLVQDSYANSVIVSSNVFLPLAIGTLLKMEIKILKPKRQRKTQRIVAFNLPWNNIKFTSIENYANDWEKFSNANSNYFFPDGLNHKGKWSSLNMN